MNTDCPSTLPLRCYNAKCLYKTSESYEEEENTDLQLCCELPLEFSFEATSTNTNTISNRLREFPVHQYKQSIIPNYGKRNLVEFYLKSEQSLSKKKSDCRDNGEMLPQNAFYYNSSKNITYPPCIGSEPRDYGFCYGTNGYEPCQFTGAVDIEDFM